MLGKSGLEVSGRLNDATGHASRTCYPINNPSSNFLSTELFKNGNAVFSFLAVKMVQPPVSCRVFRLNRSEMLPMYSIINVGLDLIPCLLVWSFVFDRCL